MNNSVKKYPSNFFAAPDIPQTKLNNAIKAYAGDLQPERVSLLIDATVFGSAKRGVLLTDDKLYYNNTGSRTVIDLTIPHQITIKSNKIICDGKSFGIVNASGLADFLSAYPNITLTVVKKSTLKKALGCGIFVFLFFALISSCVETGNEKEAAMKTAIEQQIEKYTTGWNLDGMKYEFVKDEKIDCYRIILTFHGTDLPNNLEKLLDNLTRGIAEKESTLLVDCKVSANPNAVVHSRRWSYNAEKYDVIATENPVASNKKRDSERLRSAKRAHMRFLFGEHISAWDGSFIPLVEAVKKEMHDSSSFEHVDTRYSLHSDEGEGEFIVNMKYRGKNMYGAVVINFIQVACTPNGEILRVIMTE